MKNVQGLTGMFGLTRARLDLVRWILIRRRGVGRGGSGVDSRLSWRAGSALDRDMARRAERRLGSTLGGAGDDVRRRAAAGVAEVAKIGTPGTGSSAVWPGSESERRGTHLGVRWSRGRPDRGTRRRGAERRRWRAQASGTEGERRGKGAGDVAHHDAELRGCVADEDRRRNGGSAARRGAPRSSNYGAAAARV